MAFFFGTLLLDVVAVSAFLLLATYFYFKRAFQYWKKKKSPFITPTFPFGNFADAVLLRKSVGELFTEYYKQLEGQRFAGIYTLTNPGMVILDPELIKTVLVKDFSYFHDRGFHFNEEKEPLSANLFLLPGKRWRQLRVKLTPTFSSGKMKMMFQILVDCGTELEKLIERITKDDQSVEVKDVLGRFGTDVVSSCAFGIQCNSLTNPDAEFLEWGKKVFEPSIKKVMLGIIRVYLPQLIKYIHIRPFDEKVSKYFQQMVRDTVEYREKNDVKRNDFLQLLIQLKNKGFVATDQKDAPTKTEEMDTTKLSMKSVAAQAFVFFAAGFEASSSTTTFALYELALHQDIQDRLRQEIITVIKKHQGKITYDCVNEMTYLDQVVSETLRKYAPATILNREVTKEYTIPGTDIVLEKGTPIIIPVQAIHHDPKHYPNPEKFDPDRFSEEEKQKRHPYVYLPFGEGPRTCIGKRFGLMQSKVGLVTLLSKFKIHVGEKTPIPLKMNKKTFVTQPIGGMWLKVTKL